MSGKRPIPEWQFVGSGASKVLALVLVALALALALALRFAPNGATYRCWL